MQGKVDAPMNALLKHKEAFEKLVRTEVEKAIANALITVNNHGTTRSVAPRDDERDDWMAWDDACYEHAIDRNAPEVLKMRRWQAAMSVMNALAYRGEKRIDVLVEDSYRIADAMLARLEKGDV